MTKAETKQLMMKILRKQPFTSTLKQNALKWTVEQGASKSTSRKALKELIEDGTLREFGSWIEDVARAARLLKRREGK